MQPILFLICLTLFFSCTRAGRFRPDLQLKIDEWSKLKELDHNDSGYVSYLRDSCTRDELLKLMENRTPIVRILAYRAIVERNEEDFFSILKKHLSDTARITWWYYNDAADEFTIADLMIRKAERKLTEQQKDTLTDTLLKKHVYLGKSKWIMREMEPDEKYYAIIKEQAKIESADCHNLGLTQAIAKFRKPGDVFFIKSRFSALSDNPYCNDNIFRGIEIFPDTSFFEILQQYFDNYIRKQKQSSYNDLEVYCRAVAVYKNKEALNILQALTQPATYPDSWYLGHNKEFVFKAIHRNNCPVYRGLYSQLKPQMDREVLESANLPIPDSSPAW